MANSTENSWANRTITIKTRLTIESLIGRIFMFESHQLCHLNVIKIIGILKPPSQTMRQFHALSVKISRLNSSLWFNAGAVNGH
jgi:hypothetical protein